MPHLNSNRLGWHIIIHNSKIMILKQIRLKNFRCFKDTDTVELKPITILVGANSSGKSSLLKFFPLLKQSCDKKFNGIFNWRNTDVDFKDFQNTITDNDTSKNIEVSLSFVDQIRKDTLDLDFSVGYNKTENIKELDIIKTRPRGTKYVLTTNHTKFVGVENCNLTTIDDYENADFEIGEKSDTDFIPELRLKGRNLRKLWKENDKQKTSDALDNMMDLYKDANSELSYLAKSIVYIKPLRLVDKREYVVNDSAFAAEILPDGSNLPYYLDNIQKDDKKFKDLNDWLKSYFNFEIRLVKNGMIEINIIDKNGKEHNLVDLGFGYSQILSVVITIWHSYNSDPDSSFSDTRVQNKIIAIEQPEVHLHSKLQSKFAAMICNTVNSCKKDNIPPINFIIETHSGAILNKIGDMVLKDVVTDEDISLLIFNRNETNGITEIKTTKYNEEGYVEEWPIDFFDEDEEG